MKMLILVVLAGLAGCMAADADSAQPDPCDDFYEALSAVPHDTLLRTAGEIAWMWNDTTLTGCEVRFVAHDSLAGPPVPTFEAIEGSEMHALGWRMSYGIGADGPGSGIFGIERDAVRCLVRWEQPAWIDDEGEFQQSDVFSMTIQCREVPSEP